MLLGPQEPWNTSSSCCCRRASSGNSSPATRKDPYISTLLFVDRIKSGTAPRLGTVAPPADLARETREARLLHHRRVVRASFAGPSEQQPAELFHVGHVRLGKEPHPRTERGAGHRDADPHVEIRSRGLDVE